MNTVLVPLFIGVALGVAFYARAIPQGDGRWWRFAGATVALALASRFAGHSWLANVLAGGAEIVAVGMIWSQGSPEAASAARKYLSAIVLAIILTTAALVLTGLGTVRPEPPFDKVAVGLLILGFALKLGLVPVYFWLPAVARASSVMTTALIIAVLDVGSFCELFGLRETAPWMFEAFAPVWITLALVSLLGAALLALAQRELKPMLAFSSIDDMGYLLLGLVLGTPAGLTGAWLGVISHGLAKIVLFGAVGAAEWYLAKPVTLDTRGLSSQVPVASAAFMLGALAFIGVPPTLGFAGHWRLYLAGVQSGGPLLVAAMTAASAMAILCYVRAIHRTWLGPANAADNGKTLPVMGAVVLLVFSMAPVFLGLAPQLLQQAPASPAHAVATVGQQR